MGPEAADHSALEVVMTNDVQIAEPRNFCLAVIIPAYQGEDQLVRALESYVFGEAVGRIRNGQGRAAVHVLQAWHTRGLPFGQLVPEH